ncbi:Flp pilus assembly protein CpaB [Chondromyces apiculatus]|uniref:Flp pilus assembly protein CpaB n=1 Tax=Chondromyces apiculatus DSM 436 TaxID=1192034 RepID=A0A017TCQ8_9BACT|nr:Flp pilus assembly protein CpaB [Chondromyces apiculatus]EYF06580.1 flp pilus assembly protein CpaB [Chondromyces apiculatus DSM 436]
MNRRALLIALIVAAMGALILAAYLHRFELEARGGESIQLLTALKPIGAGALITDDMLATRAVPRAYVEDRAILAKDREKIVGLRMGQTVQAQQTLMWTDLAIAMEERRNLSSLVQPGMRAVTVSASSRADKSYALIQPGDRIDVVVTVPSGVSKDQTSSVVLLQNVLVLAVGTDTTIDQSERASNKDKSELLLSLSLTVQEAQLLSLATEKGKLSVALRNPDDVRVTEGISDMSSTALADVQARGQAQNVRKTGPVGPVKIEAEK